MRCVYYCADNKLEEILSSTCWSTVSCINEDVVDPGHVMELASESSDGYESMVKDLRKNLWRVQKANADGTEIRK